MPLDCAADSRKAWLSLVGHYNGTGELSKRVERAKEEITRLHYKDEKVFPFEKYITKLKEISTCWRRTSTRT